MRLSDAAKKAKNRPRCLRCPRVVTRDNRRARGGGRSGRCCIALGEGATSRPETISANL